MGKRGVGNDIFVLYLWEPLLLSASQTCSGADEGQATPSSAIIALRGVPLAGA